MKLLINTATTYKGGSVQVAQSFITECKAFDQHEYVVVLGLKLAEQLDRKDFPGNFRFIEIPYRPATKVKHLWYQEKFLQKIEKQEKPDVVFTTSGPAYWRSEAPHLIGYNLPHYIYRDSPFFNLVSKSSKWKWWMKGSLIRHYYRRDADLLVGQTEDVAKRANKWLNIPAATVSNTCSDAFHAYPKGKQSEKYIKPDGKFRVLTISGYYPHKHLEIIEGISKYLDENCVKNIRFVLTLGNDEFKEKFSESTRRYIDNVGPVSNTEAPALYSDCQAMFLPTLLECFSASYPESMVMEKPIITTSMGFATSICGDAALYFEPLHAEKAYQRIMELSTSEELRKSLVEKGLKQLKTFNTPQERAKAYLCLCEQLLNHIK